MDAVGIVSPFFCHPNQTAEEDHRCPMEQAEQFFTALKLLGVSTELIRFPGENHDLSRSRKPKHREQRLNHMIRWFKEYL